MRQVVNRKIYDTSKADLVALEYQGYQGDLDFWAEYLYRTRKGDFFIYGTGGARSKYARRTGRDWWGPGEAIVPVSREEALKWCQRHQIRADIIENLFSLEEA